MRPYLKIKINNNIIKKAINDKNTLNNISKIHD
jgi:hypothetical protein